MSNYLVYYVAGWQTHKTIIAARSFREALELAFAVAKDTHPEECPEIISIQRRLLDNAE